MEPNIDVTEVTYTIDDIENTDDTDGTSEPDDASSKKHHTHQSLNYHNNQTAIEYRFRP